MGTEGLVEPGAVTCADAGRGAEAQSGRSQPSPPEVLVVEVDRKHPTAFYLNKLRRHFAQRYAGGPGSAVAPERSVQVVGVGPALCKAVAVAEQLKRVVPDLWQWTDIGTVQRGGRAGHGTRREPPTDAAPVAPAVFITLRTSLGDTAPMSSSGRPYQRPLTEREQSAILRCMYRASAGNTGDR
ncbi:hypothetical protein CDCA_CDCA02G0509 [Cyanidium caldarium]|uniref:DNA/RNA-binding protein Alba-like domain-containing protein n=1 Tax=Cyanidium caldarium TaxID=2771 RepID=A0AAV9IQR8_CYACA|nr:hypothetical protein CDCA_CDCA02G0509 [Cyanidium caldarium]